MHPNGLDGRSRRKALEAWRYPKYRAYWLGLLASVSSFQILQVALGWLVYKLSGSVLYLGYVGLAMAVPGLALNLFGGVVADKVDQRRLIMVTQVSAGTVILVVGLLTHLDLIQVWHVLVGAFLIGSLSAFDEPARQALFPRLVDRSALMSAVALNSSIWQGTRTIAPAAAGLIIAQWGSAAALMTGCIGYYVLGSVMASLQLPPIVQAERIGVLHELREGVSYVRQHSVFMALIGMTFLNSLFGMAYIRLMPVFAEDVLAVGATGLGFLLSTNGAGALSGTILMSLLGDIEQKGRLITTCAVLFGCFVMVFGLSNSYPLSLILLFFAGLFHTSYMISTMTSLQILVPDTLRGRVMGIYAMTWNITPLSAIQASMVATLVGVQIAISIGGAAVATYAVGLSFTALARNLAPAGPLAAGNQASYQESQTKTT